MDSPNLNQMVATASNPAWAHPISPILSLIVGDDNVNQAPIYDKFANDLFQGKKTFDDAINNTRTQINEQISKKQSEINRLRDDLIKLRQPSNVDYLKNKLLEEQIPKVLENAGQVAKINASAKALKGLYPYGINPVMMPYGQFYGSPYMLRRVGHKKSKKRSKKRSNKRSNKRSKRSNKRLNKRLNKRFGHPAQDTYQVARTLYDNVSMNNVIIKNL